MEEKELESLSMRKAFPAKGDHQEEEVQVTVQPEKEEETLKN
ncbi:hypothetical protein M901_2608 [Bacteriovorax sp. DB6_IX]|nr:hypothetical protein M901_2608 [Bacteriovorax sp. DB6_IX]